MKKIIWFTFLLILVCGSANAGLDDGLVAYYPFNGNANDESGNGNNGTVNGATLTEDRFGNADNAYKFDGDEDYIKIPLLFNQDQDPISISVWAKIENEHGGIIYCENNNNGNGSRNAFYLQPSMNESGTLSYEQIPPHLGNGYIEAEIKDDINKWIYVTLVKHNDILYGYKNGEYIGQISHTESYSGQAADFSIIGARYDSNKQWIYEFYGKIDDIRIYDRPLNEAEIKALYYEGVDEGSIQYKIGFNAGIQKCVDDPASCGITETSANVCTQEQLDSAVFEATSTLIKPDGTSVLDGTKVLFTLEEITNKVQEALENGDFYTHAQVEEKIGKVLAWGDFDGDGKIGLEEAIKALMVIADNKEE